MLQEVAHDGALFGHMFDFKKVKFVVHAQVGMLVALEHVSGGERIHLFFALLTHSARPCADFFVQSAMAQTSGRGALRR